MKKYNLKKENTDMSNEAPNENDEELDENTIQATSSEPDTMDTDVNNDVPKDNDNDVPEENDNDSLQILLDYFDKVNH